MHKKKIIILTLIMILVLLFILGFFWWNKKRIENLNIGDQSLNRIKKSGKLIIGSDFDYGVMEFFDSNGQPVGIDIDLGKEIAKRLGVQAEIKAFEWQDLFSVINDQEADIIISSVTITEERSERILFSAPYFNGGQVIVAKADNSDIKTKEDLKDKKIGVQTGTVSNDEAKKLTTPEKIVTYDSWGNSTEKGGIVYDLKAGRFDAIIVDYIQAVDSIKKDSEIKIVGDPFTQEYYGIATKLGNNELIKAINNIIRDIKKEGVLKNIEDKWIKS